MVSPTTSLPDSDIAIPEPHEAQHESSEGGCGCSSDVNVGQAERVVSILLGSLFVAKGVKRFSLSGLLFAGAGAALIHRGATGSCAMYKALHVNTADEQEHGKALTHPFHQHIRVEHAVTVNKPIEEVYQFWRKLENLPTFMHHLKAVTEIDEKRSHWEARGPRGRTVQWNADIVADVPNQRIAWRSIEGADVPNAGQVVFEKAGNETRVHVVLAYDPPAGIFGAIFARLFGEEPHQTVKEDLRRLKQTLEANEVATTEGQPQGNCK